MSDEATNEKKNIIPDREYVIQRLLELPGLIAESNAIIIECEEKAAWERNHYERLKNELAAYLAISRLI